MSQDRSEQQSKDRLEGKSEILWLRAQMHRVEEERDLLKKNRAVLYRGVRVKYRFMSEHRHEYPLALMCRVLPVARAGFCASLRCPLSERAKDDARLLELIRHSYAASHGVCGARRVFVDLREAGESCGRHRVERLMQCHKIKAVRGYKKPRSIAGGPSIIAPNHLQREFTADPPNKVWVTDITYIRTWQGCCTWRWCWTCTPARLLAGP